MKKSCFISTSTFVVNIIIVSGLSEGGGGRISLSVQCVVFTCCRHASDSVTWRYVEDMDSKTALVSETERGGYR